MLRRAEIEKTSVGIIEVGRRRRVPSEGQITQMMESLKAVGLLTPILVRVVFDDPAVERAESINHIELVCGATRLAAAKRLGWRAIDTQFAEGDEIDFREAEIVENLHRGELTVLERAEWTAELVRIQEERQEGVQSGQLVQIESKRTDGRGHRAEGGDAQAARLLESDPEKQEAKRKQIHRDKKIASIAPEAKAAAEEGGLADNQRALLEIAAQATPEAQVTRADELVAKKKAGGKKRKTKQSDIEDDLDEDPENYRTAFLLRVDVAIRFAAYSGPITAELVAAARQVAVAWNRLAKRMENGANAPPQIPETIPQELIVLCEARYFWSKYVEQYRLLSPIAKVKFDNDHEPLPGTAA